MSHRFFLENEISDENVVIVGDQAHHAAQVMRFSTGDDITLFDGRGNEYLATITEIGKKRIVCAIKSSKSTQPALANEITIAVALPKGDRQKFLLEKLVELGVTRLIPLTTNRSVVVPNKNVIERYRKSVIEASKQCGRNYLMEITEPNSINSLIASYHPSESSICILADPYAASELPFVLEKIRRSRSAERSHDMLIAIGPEGGFDESEVARFQSANWCNARIGRTILRIETAAIAAAVIGGIGLN